VYGFAQHQSNNFNNVFTDCGTNCANFGASSAAVTGGLIEEYVSDRFKVTPWLTLIAGLRESHFSVGGISGTQPGIVENATDPRFGVAIRIPRLNWVFRGFWGQFYQAPPLLTATGPVLDLASSQSLAFAPLRGERDKEWQFGVMIPFHGWVLGRRQFSDQRHELARPQQHRRIEPFLAAHLEFRFDSRLGDDAAFTALLESRSGALGLLESDRAGHIAVYGRSGLPDSDT
jgi:hypothetical protein